MNRLLLWLVIAVGWTMPALAQSPAYPKDVQAVLDFAGKSCLDGGGESVRFSDEDIQKADLNGDGRDDYIVHLQNAECPANLAAFCGTAGCDLSILIAQRNGRYINVFDQRVRGYEIKPGRGARTIRFQLHGNYCGGHGNPSCFKNRRITGKKFAIKAPK